LPCASPFLHIPSNPKSSPSLPIHTYKSRFLTIDNLLHRPILIDVDVHTIRLVVHGAHAVRLEDAVLLGEIGLCKRLFPSHAFSSYSHPRPEFEETGRGKGKGQGAKRTTSSWLSPIFFPMSLLSQSALSPPSVFWIPGTTRGILCLLGAVVKVRVRCFVV